MFTAIAMVPLLVIRTMVMIAIRISGMRLPPMSSAKTSLTFGQGTVVDILTFMYEVRKHVKMKVSLRRKIHIIAFPQGTWKASLSLDQSVTTPVRPVGAVLGPCPSIRLVADIGFDPKAQVDNNTANSTSQTSRR